MHCKNKVVILAKYLVAQLRDYSYYTCRAGKGFMQWELMLE